MQTDRRKITLGATLLVLSGALLLHSNAVDAILPLGLVTTGAVGLVVGSTLGRRTAVHHR